MLSTLVYSNCRKHTSVAHHSNVSFMYKSVQSTPVWEHNYSTLVCNTHSYAFCKYVHNTPMRVRCTHEPQNTSALVTHVLWLCVFRMGVLSTPLHISAFSTHVRCFFTNCASIKTFTIYRIHTSVLLFHKLCVLTNPDERREGNERKNIGF